MKTLFSKCNSISLIKRIIAGLILGVILAVAVPKAQAISILGDLFVGALKAIAPVPHFFSGSPFAVRAEDRGKAA